MNSDLDLRARCLSQRYALKKSPGAPVPSTESREDQGAYVEGERNPVLCRRCLHEVTTADRIITVNGGHEHTFTNPAGITYHIGCFSSAHGCIIHGIPTDEFTWFSGHAWAVALCSNCQIHLGWYFQSEGASFFGLILENLLKKIKFH